MRKTEPSEGRDESPLGHRLRERDSYFWGWDRKGKAGEEGRTPTSVFYRTEVGS